MRKHVHLRVLDVELVAKCLPLSEDQCAIRFFFSKKNPSPEQLKQLKLHLPSRAIVRSLLDFFMKHNPHYANISINEDNINSVDGTSAEYNAKHVFVEQRKGCPENLETDGPFDRVSWSSLEDGVMIGTCTTTVGETEHNPDNSDETYVKEILEQVRENVEKHAKGDTETDPSSIDHETEQPPVTDKPVNTSTRTFRISAGTFIDTNLDTWIEQTFPRLFLYGRGGPRENRDTYVSTRNCIAHYLRPSTRQFQDYEFILTVYDILSRQDVANRARVEGKKRFNQPQDEFRSEAYARIKPNVFALACAYVDACKLATKARHPRPEPPPR